MSLKIELARNLLQINAIKLSPQRPFQWASGLYSPIYCDNRVALSYPSVRDLIIDGFVSLTNSRTDPQMIAGVATSGIAFGALVADRLNLPFVYVRSKAKSHGRQNLIEGYWDEGMSCVVIEDLISTGGSSLSAVEALRKNGLHVDCVLAIFTYQLKAAEDNFRTNNCEYYSLSNYENLIHYASGIGKFTANEMSLLKKWVDDPQKWSEDFRNLKK